MDNDSKIKQRIVKNYRNIRMKFDYGNKGLLSLNDGNQLISQLLTSEAPFMVGRLGAVEMHCVNRWLKKKAYTSLLKERAKYAAGIFPNDEKTLNHFCEVYLAALKYCDCIGVWEVEGEKKL